MRGAMESAARAGERRAERHRRAIADEADALPGVHASVAGEDVLIEGRGLLDRWLSDARLRNIGRAGI